MKLLVIQKMYGKVVRQIPCSVASSVILQQAIRLYQ